MKLYPILLRKSIELFHFMLFAPFWGVQNHTIVSSAERIHCTVTAISNISYIDYDNQCTFSLFFPRFLSAVFPLPADGCKKNPLKSKRKNRRPCKGTGGGLLLGDSVCHGRQTVRFSTVWSGGLSKNDAFFAKDQIRPLSLSSSSMSVPLVFFSTIFSSSFSASVSLISEIGFLSMA